MRTRTKTAGGIATMLAAATGLALAPSALGQPNGLYQIAIGDLRDGLKHFVALPEIPTQPQQADLVIHGTFWDFGAIPGPWEVQMMDLVPDLPPNEPQYSLSDRFIYYNAPNATGGLEAHILMMSDPDQFQPNPTWLPGVQPIPIGATTVIATLDEQIQNLYTLTWHYDGPPPEGFDYFVTFASDGPTDQGTISDFISIQMVPTPGAAALLGLGVLGFARRRRAN